MGLPHHQQPHHNTKKDSCPHAFSLQPTGHSNTTPRAVYPRVVSQILFEVCSSPVSNGTS
jgi:hypothetical protein